MDSEPQREPPSHHRRQLSDLIMVFAGKRLMEIPPCRIEFRGSWRRRQGAGGVFDLCHHQGMRSQHATGIARHVSLSETVSRQKIRDRGERQPFGQRQIKLLIFASLSLLIAQRRIVSHHMPGHPHAA